MTVIAYRPAAAYVCGTLVTFPVRLPVPVPSPKSILTELTAAPVASPATLIPKVAGTPAVTPLPGGVIVTVSAARGLTVTDAVVVVESPSASKPVAETRNEPGPPYTCEMAPGKPVYVSPRPSPQLTARRTTELAVLLVPGVTGIETD